MILKWRVTPQQAWPSHVQAQVDALEADLVEFVNSITSEVTADMQMEAPWTDRTGAARAALFASLIHETRRVVGILISHGSLIYYGVYLEFDHAGRFAVIAPTLDRLRPLFLDNARRIMRARFGGRS